MVLIRPMRRDSQAATGNEIAPSRLEPEEKQARRFQRQIESLKQPQRQQRLHDKAAGKGIQAEQRREPVDDASRWPERGFRRLSRVAVVARQARVEQRRQQSQRGIEIKHQLDGAEFSPAVDASNSGSAAASDPTAAVSAPIRL